MVKGEKHNIRRLLTRLIDVVMKTEEIHAQIDKAWN